MYRLLLGSERVGFFVKYLLLLPLQIVKPNLSWRLSRNSVMRILRVCIVNTHLVKFLLCMCDLRLVEHRLESGRRHGYWGMSIGIHGHPTDCLKVNMSKDIWDSEDQAVAEEKRNYRMLKYFSIRPRVSRVECMPHFVPDVAE